MIIKHLLRLIPFILLVTVTFGTIYAVAQQMLRLSANDQPLQIAQEMVNNLNITDSPQLELSKYQQEVDPSKSYSPFIIVFNKQNQLLAGTAIIDGSIPEVPSGVLNHAQKNGQNRITWRPTTGIRVAIIVLPYKNGTVVVGKSLKEVENRINAIGMLVLIGYVLSLGGVVGTTFLRR